MHGVSLTLVGSVKSLGVLLDSALCRDKQVGKVPTFASDIWQSWAPWAPWTGLPDPCCCDLQNVSVWGFVMLALGNYLVVAGGAKW